MMTVKIMKNKKIKKTRVGIFKNMGRNIPGGNFSGVNSPGGSLIGGNFLGGNFPGGRFPDTFGDHDPFLEESY